MRIAGYPDGGLHYGQQYVAGVSSTTTANGQSSSLSNLAPARQPSEPINTSFTQEARRCSVRGCNKALAPDAANKMCDECRGRHRIYAMTKRAKRKQEKAAILSQSTGIASPSHHGPIWMPEETVEGMEKGQQTSAVHQLPGPSQSGKDTVSAPLYDSTSQPQWDSNGLDPRLFASQSSELAGALTYTSPSTQTHQTSHNGASVDSAPVSGNSFEDQAPSSVPEPEPTTSPEPSEGSPRPPSSSHVSSSAARYCSVKGCKAIIRGEYFFKMCESCRNRYRGYGITKRAKWKESREAANAELDALREEEDKCRVERGLLPLTECPADFHEWEAKTIEQIDGSGPIFAEDGTVRGPVLPARMCTVSHCHRVLSGHYKYRRCEQHRLQNRYHSRLKRVREKDLKAIGPGVFGDASLSDEEEEDQAKKPRLLEPLFTSAPIDIVRGSREDDYDNEDTAHYMEQMAGIPPAARGIRRENHVCSVKTCFNLLSPSVPWKMCDTCRAHDRKVRRERRLRDLGELPPLPPRASQKKTKQPTEKSVNDSEDDGQTDESVDHATQPFSSSNTTDESSDVPQPDSDMSDRNSDGTLIFTEPLAPLPANVDSNTSSGGEPSTSLDPPPIAVQNTAPTTSINGIAPSTTTTVRRRVRKSANQRIGQMSFPAFPTPPSAPTQPNASFRLPGDVGSYMPPAPSYPLPYYMPPPYGMSPYNAPQTYVHPYIIGPSTPTATSSLHPLSSAQAQVSTSSHQNQHQPHPLPMPAQYGTYPPHSYGPYASYPYPYIPPGQYIQHSHPYPPYPGPYASATYGGHYQMPPPGVHPPNPQVRSIPSASTSQSRKRKKTDTPPAQVPTPSSSVPPSPPPLMSSMPLVAQVPPASSSTFVTRPPVIVPLLGYEAQAVQRSATPVSDESEENDVQQHLTQQDPIGADKANVLSSHQGRQCHMCQRSLGASISGGICERCRAKLKKRSAKVKQRFKLEPRKAAIRAEAL
ncbi:hypothetical protein BS17DRAFT_882210 [Gyrodon lividus]|nr:hypothetical protein BS17DRAFT_882210 [Gyrodon lividus]